MPKRARRLTPAQESGAVGFVCTGDFGVIPNAAWLDNKRMGQVDRFFLLRTWTATKEQGVRCPRP